MKYPPGSYRHSFRAQSWASDLPAIPLIQPYVTFILFYFFVSFDLINFYLARINKKKRLEYSNRAKIRFVNLVSLAKKLPVRMQC